MCVDDDDDGDGGERQGTNDARSFLIHLCSHNGIYSHASSPACLCHVCSCNHCLSKSGSSSSTSLSSSSLSSPSSPTAPSTLRRLHSSTMANDNQIETFPPSKLGEYKVVDEIAEGTFGKVKSALLLTRCRGRS